MQVCPQCKHRKKLRHDSLDPERQWAARTSCLLISGPPSLQRRYLGECHACCLLLTTKRKGNIKSSRDESWENQHKTTSNSCLQKGSLFYKRWKEDTRRLRCLFPFPKGSTTPDEAQGLYSSFKNRKGKLAIQIAGLIKKKVPLSNKGNCSPQKPPKRFLSSLEQLRAFLGTL